MKLKLLLAVLLLVPAASSVFAQTHPSADLIITNAKVWTVDKSRPRAEAVAVIGERIVAVGGSSEIDGWRGPQTKLIDAQGKLLLPGFNDAHLHFLSGGAQLDQVDLKDASSVEEFARRKRQRVSGFWEGVGMSRSGPQRKCPPRRQLTRSLRTPRCL
jgi:predicted amidohydrolase YtcJ